jgi:DTW domain-containing protein YfiP
MHWAKPCEQVNRQQRRPPPRHRQRRANKQTSSLHSVRHHRPYHETALSAGTVRILYFDLMRVTCYRCFWPQTLCWCGSITPMETRTRFVFLMHPKEFKQEKAATGRLTHLCLANSAVHMGVTFDEHEEVQAIIHDARNFPVLLYPGREAINFTPSASKPTDPRLGGFNAELGHRQLVVFLIDATWPLGRKMLNLSRSLQALPRIMFTPSAPSRYVIKHQPHAGCLSTLEATHELLVSLEQAGIDRYPLPEQLLGLFQRMQDFQLRCASDPNRAGYRRRPYKPPAERTGFQGQSASRRASVFQTPD